MLYRIFKWLFYLTLKGYFRSISIKGKSNIPGSGPVIFVANHNSAFMDPILLAVFIHRSVYFLARGESFKSYLVSKFFGWLNMIPIFRPEIAPDKVHRNKSAFEACYRHLKKGKALLIFPEGFSETVRKLRPLKTGTARIALGAEQLYGFDLYVKIVPIGINYSNPHHFRSNVTINFGTPINVSKYGEDYRENEKETVAQLTDEIRQNMEELLVIVNNDQLNKLVGSVEELYRGTFAEELESQSEPINDFEISKDIARMIEFYQELYPKKLASIEQKLDNYLAQLEQLKIRDSQIGGHRVPIQFFGKFLYFIFGLPFCVYGYLVNIIPFSLAQLLSKNIRVRKDFIGSMKIAFGMFVFLIFYIIEIVLVALYLNWFWALLFAFSLYPTGLFTLTYLKNYYLVLGQFRYFSLFKRRSRLLMTLRVTRKELLNELQEIRATYLSRGDIRI